MRETYPVPFNSLRHFYWAAKLSSFKLAAKHLNLSEAAISLQIRNLEQTLNVELFHRYHQRIELSAKGKQFFPYIESAFSSIHHGFDAIGEDPEPNRLALTTMPSFASHWLICRLASFNNKFPEISISIDTSVERRDFETDFFDLGIRYGKGQYPGLVSKLLLKDPIVLVCSPKLLKSSTITREDILKLPLIRGTFEGVDLALQGFKDFFQFTDQQLAKSLLLRDGGLGAEAARSGQGISMQRLSLVADMIDSGELVFATQYAFGDFNFYAVAPTEKISRPKVNKFLGWLTQEMQLTEQRIAPLIARIEN